MTIARVALLFFYRICSPRGLEIFLQLHSDGKTWRFFGGHIEVNESPPHAAMREAREELGLRLDLQELGEGWTPFQLITRVRLPAGRVFVFPVEVDGAFPPPNIEVREGAGAAWWPVHELPPSMSRTDKVLAKLWTLRRQILNQPYVLTPLACPVVTIDLEELHHYGGRQYNPRFDDRDSRLPQVVADLLGCLKSADAKATFFCVARTAQKYQDLLRDIIHAGHEVASHGTDHQLVRTQTPSQLHADLLESMRIINQVVGASVVIGFRAPAWSWPKDPIHREQFYTALQRAGYAYSSSVLPAFGFGIANAPSMPYQTPSGIWEFPLPVFRLPFLSGNLERHTKNGQCPPPGTSPWRSVGIPYSGGLFMRCWGACLARMLLSYHLKKRGYAMVYAHPGELGAWDARWVRSLDARYLNLAERWRLGFRSRGFKDRFFRLIREYGGCSAQHFLATLNRPNEC